MLRTLQGDEGCDHECRYCGRVLLTGTCGACGYTVLCVGCDKPADRMYVNETPTGKDFGRGRHIDFVPMCDACADVAFEQQNDDARTP